MIPAGFAGWSLAWAEEFDGGRPAGHPDRSTAFPQAMLIDYVRRYTAGETAFNGWRERSR